MEPEKTPRERVEDLISLLVSDWRPTAGQILWAIRITVVLVAVLGLLTIIGSPFGITLWQWLKLLIVPAVIAAGGLWFNRQQRDRELEIAQLRTQDEALREYLNQMLALLTDKEQPLDKARPGDNLSAVVRARTVTVLAILDGHRRGAVVQFLYEANLIHKDAPLHLLQGCNIRGIRLAHANLSGIKLSGFKLSEWETTIGGGVRATMIMKTLTSLADAKLNGANLTGAELAITSLKSADLDFANLREAKLSEADLREASLMGANLIDAKLDEANLHGAKLVNADLSGANLREAILSVADLSGANLSRVVGITSEELAQEALDLEDATMPDGQKYEDWLKDRVRSNG